MKDGIQAEQIEEINKVNLLIRIRSEKATKEKTKQNKTDCVISIYYHQTKTKYFSRCEWKKKDETEEKSFKFIHNSILCLIQTGS